MYFDVKLEDLRAELETLSQDAFIHIEEAVKFLYQNLHIVDVQLLPYPAQLIFISEFFRINKSPDQEALKKLETWFWKTTYSNYFTASLSHQKKTYSVFKEFASAPTSLGGIVDSMDFSAAEFPEKLNFTGVRPKALQLFMLKKIFGNALTNEDFEGVKQLFIFNRMDKDMENMSKDPANMLLRLSSEFEVNKEKKDVRSFIHNSSLEELNKYFIDERLQTLFMENKFKEFLEARKEWIRSEERKFVEELGIYYT